MKCSRCGSENVTVQAVTVTKNKHHGFFYWFFFGWLIDLMLWMILTLPMLIVAIFKPRKVASKTHSEAVCQNCGKRWRV